MKIEEEFFSKLKRIASVKKKKLAEKTDQRIRGQENVLLSRQNCQNISGEKTHRCNVNLKTIISPGKQSIFQEHNKY